MVDTDQASLIELHQHLMNQEDDSLRTLFGHFTFLGEEEVQGVLEEHGRNPGLKRGQELLAREVLGQVTDCEETVRAVLTYRRFFDLDFDRLVGSEEGGVGGEIGRASCRERV